MYVYFMYKHVVQCSLLTNDNKTKCSNKKEENKHERTNEKNRKNEGIEAQKKRMKERESQRKAIHTRKPSNAFKRSKCRFGISVILECIVFCICDCSNV